LPLFNSAGGPSLKVVASGGGSASSLSQDSTGGWPLETSLDVEWAHAMAPGANILLVEAPDGSNASIFNAVQYAASQPGVAVVSMSWGTNEFSGETSYDSIFQPKSSTNPNGSNPGVTFVAASGDSGAGAIYPAASPYVLSVGGTTLGGSTSSTSGYGFGSSGFGSTSFFSWGSYFARSASARPGGGLYSGSGSLSITPATDPGGGSNPYPGESAWSGSGGGPSSYEGYPSYQYNQPWIAQNYGYPYNVQVTNNTTGTTSDYSARMTPDVAYNANPSTGYAIYDSIASASYGTVAGWNEVGGTSAAAPQWSAIIALADQQRSLSDGGSGASAGKPLDTNQVLTTLYNTLGSSPANSTYTSVFHDITTGSNGYAAGTGYDLATGLGTPIVNNLVPLLAGTSIVQGGLPTIQGSGYGGGGSSSGFGFGSTSSGGFGSTSLYGFSASSQPGGGLYAGSGSISILPGSADANGLTTQPGGATVASATPQQVSTLTPASPIAAAGSTSSAASTNTLASQGNNVFGASGWNGSALLARLSSLDLPAPGIGQPADDLSQNTEEIDDQSADGAIVTNDDASGEYSFAFDVAAPALHDGDAGNGGGGGDG
jgi:subtilase family serine protease